MSADANPPASADSSALTKPLFTDIDADNDANEVTQIESLCFNCHEQGMTRLLLTKIPYFREVILSSFRCEECNYTDTDVQYGGRLQDKGVRYEVNIRNARDLNRQVVKSEYASFALPHLEFEQPQGKKGEINTVEGLIDGVIRGLEQDQPVRKAMNPEVAEKVEAFIAKLQDVRVLKEPFKIILDDPSGNSYIENPVAPKKDPASTMAYYVRTAEQNQLLGVSAEEASGLETGEEGGERKSKEDSAEGGEKKSQTEGEKEDGDPALKSEVLTFPGNCPNCCTPIDTRMKMVDIPFFKEVIIMATTCAACGYRENEVKSGSGVEDQGTRITLHVTDPSDLSRDVLKSDTCGLLIPDIDLELVEGTLGGRFTTVEGLLVQIKDQLRTTNPFMVGDGAAPDTMRNLDTFLEKLDALISGDTATFTLVLDDPAGNSFMQNVYAPDPDPELTVERYTRTQQQNEDLGLADMRTENYAES